MRRFTTAILILLAIASCSKPPEKETGEHLDANLGPGGEVLLEGATIAGLINEFYLQNHVLPPLGTTQLAEVLRGKNNTKKNYLPDDNLTVTADGVFLFEHNYRYHAYVTTDDEIVVVLEAGGNPEADQFNAPVETRIKLVQISK